MEKNLSIIVVPHDQAKTRTYNVSHRMLTSLFVLTMLFLAVLLFFMATYGKLLFRADEVTHLENENKKLRLQNAQVDSLKFELLQMQALSIQIKRMFGLDLSQADSLLVAELSAVTKSSAIISEELQIAADEEEQKRQLRAVPTMWPVEGYVTNEFYTTGGQKSDKYHPGIDIAAAQDTPVKACADGVVVTSGWDETYGMIVVIDHGFDIYTLYGHNSRNGVKVGDRVARGQTVAFVGTSGKSSAPHLHFEVRKKGLPVNPREYLLN
jgi:murein DD-endopeptidase MepM/ murein hydrolase activator NlpD